MKILSANQKNCIHQECFLRENPKIGNLGALPPWAQKAREIEAIKNDQRLQKLLNGEKIKEIRETENGYVVVTDSNRYIQVNVLYPSDPNADPLNPVLGPVYFEIEFPEAGNLGALPPWFQN